VKFCSNQRRCETPLMNKVVELKAADLHLDPLDDCLKERTILLACFGDDRKDDDSVSVDTTNDAPCQAVGLQSPILQAGDLVPAVRVFSSLAEAWCWRSASDRVVMPYHAVEVMAMDSVRDPLVPVQMILEFFPAGMTDSKVNNLFTTGILLEYSVSLDYAVLEVPCSDLDRCRLQIMKKHFIDFAGGLFVWENDNDFEWRLHQLSADGVIPWGTGLVAIKTKWGVPGQSGTPLLTAKREVVGTFVGYREIEGERYAFFSQAFDMAAPIFAITAAMGKALQPYEECKKKKKKGGYNKEMYDSAKRSFETLYGEAWNWKDPRVRRYMHEFNVAYEHMDSEDQVSLVSQYDREESDDGRRDDRRAQREADEFSDERDFEAEAPDEYDYDDADLEGYTHNDNSRAAFGKVSAEYRRWAYYPAMLKTGAGQGDPDDEELQEREELAKFDDVNPFELDASKAAEVAPFPGATSTPGLAPALDEMERQMEKLQAQIAAARAAERLKHPIVAKKDPHADLRAQLMAQKAELEAAGNRLDRVITLTEEEQNKYPPITHGNMLLKKQVAALVKINESRKRALAIKERNSRQIRRAQEEIDRNMATIAKLRAEIQNLGISEENFR